MPKTVHFIFCLIILFVLSGCSRKNLAVLLEEVKEQPATIIFKNNLSVNNVAGHLQGVQVYRHKRKNYYFISGSSDNQSYLAIADINQKKVLSVNKILDDPFRHAGGFQILDNLLAIGMEDNIEVDKSVIHLYEIIDPGSISDVRKPNLKLLKTIDRKGAAKRYTAGCVALAKRKKDLWIAVGNWDTKNIDVYSIKSKDIKTPNKNFELVYSIDAEKINTDNWIEKSWYPYQNINFLTGSKKDLYLAGTAFTDSTKIEIVDIFKVSENFELKKIAHRTFEKPTSSTFRWGGGIYFEKRNRMHILSTGEHITDSLFINLYADEKK